MRAKPFANLHTKARLVAALSSAGGVGRRVCVCVGGGSAMAAAWLSTFPVISEDSQPLFPVECRLRWMVPWSFSQTIRRDSAGMQGLVLFHVQCCIPKT